MVLSLRTVWVCSIVGWASVWSAGAVRVVCRYEGGVYRYSRRCNAIRVVWYLPCYQTDNTKSIIGLQSVVPQRSERALTDEARSNGEGAKLPKESITDSDDAWVANSLLPASPTLASLSSPRTPTAHAAGPNRDIFTGH